MPGGPRDKYANIMTFDVTETAAGTVTFGEVVTNVGIDSSRKKGVAILVDQVNYFPSAAGLGQMTSAGDDILASLTISSGVTDLEDMADRRILDGFRMTRVDFGAAAAAQIFKVPVIHQFFPPLIFAERSIYLGVQSSGLASATRITARVLYRTVEINAEEFVEIAEVFRLVS